MYSYIKSTSQDNVKFGVLLTKDEHSSILKSLSSSRDLVLIDLYFHLRCGLTESNISIEELSLNFDCSDRYLGRVAKALSNMNNLTKELRDLCLEFETILV